MRKILIILMFVCLTAGMVMAAGGAVPVARDNNGGQYITDRFVITIKPGVAPLVVNTMISGQVYTGNSRIDLLCAQNKVKSVELFYDHPVRNPILRSLVERIYIFHIDPKLDARDVYANFAVCDDIETSDLYIVPEIFFTPNDPQISQQWALAKVNATQAWDVVHGDTTKRVIIAIDDTGVYFNNPDLQANIWINTPEDINHNGIFDAGDINGQDEDGNSYNDDVVGWDLGTADNNPEEEEPTHGTHVAGCASEVTNNGIGGAGLGYSAKIMCVKVANASGQLTQGYQGLVYAADNGAHIINCSWGSPSSSSYGLNVCNYVNSIGVLIVCAAGNDDYWTPPYINYPSYYTSCFAVASSSPEDIKSSFSNYGAWVDISAPGQDIYTTYGPTGYTTLSGTSMASPIVAGLAALLKAQNPSWQNTDIVARLQATAVDIDSLNPSYQGMLGAGRIDAYAALALGRYPNFALVSHGETLISDDGDGVVNPGESISVRVTLINYWATGHNVVAKLRAPAGITVTDSISNFGTFDGDGATRDNSSDLFALTFDQAIVPGQYGLTLSISSDDPSYREIEFPVRVTLEKAHFPMSLSESIESNPLIFDINFDGIKEIIIGCNDNKVYAIEPDGSNLTGWPVEGIDDFSAGAAVGDLEHDGDYEVVANTKNGAIYAWHANGTLVTGFPVFTDSTMYAIPVLGDLDNNGDLEIIAASYGAKKIFIFNHDGSAFGTWPYTGTSGWYGSVALGNIDSDPELEIVAGGFDQKIHAFNVDKTEVTGWPVNLNNRAWAAPVIGNVDPSDSEPEIAIAAYTGSIYLLNHDGTNVSGWPISVTGTNIKTAPILADLTGDGNPELIIGTNNSNIYAYQYTGAIVSGFPLTVAAPVKNTPVVADLSGDGQPDIVVAVGGSSTMIYGFNAQGQLLRNFPIATATLGSILGSPALDDIDRDGDMDIVVGVQSSGNNLDVIDYKVPISTANIRWPFFGNDLYRSNNFVKFISGIDQSSPNTPSRFELLQNYPNPFNSTTMIRYNLAAESPVEIGIYDILGRLLKTINLGYQQPGNHQVAWNGRDDSGLSVGSGVYFYKITAGERSQIRRMLYLK